MFKRLSKILRVPLPRLTKALEENKGDPLTPIIVKTAVHEDQVATLLEHQADFPGVEVASTYLRDYEHQALAAQVLGYVGEISPEELKRWKRRTRHPRRREDRQDRGRGGVRPLPARHARDRAAPRRLARPAAGRFEPRRPRSPAHVRLTLDIGLQRAAERALRDGIELARQDDKCNANGGAIVALDPRDGAVLAMASNPTYKPSVYVGRVDPKKLEPLVVEKVAKQWNYPGINRAIAGVYPPGSTFKPVTALAAIQDGLLSPYEYIQCTPSATYGLDEFRVQELEPVHERGDDALDRARAVVRHLLLRRRQPLLRAGRARAAVLDEDAGLGEEVRLRPAGGPRHRRRGGRPPADAGVAQDLRPDRLGQGLEPGRLDPARDRPEGPHRDAAADGALLRDARERRQARHAAPRLAVEQPGGRGQPAVPCRRFPPRRRSEIGVDPGALAVVRDGLYEATHDANGTSSGVFGSFPVPIAGKTGTAEKVVNLPGYPPATRGPGVVVRLGPVRRHDSSPRGAKRTPLVVCALIENGGHGGSAAAPPR